MKAALIDAYGTADQITVGDFRDVLPTPGKLVVEVRAASLNPWDSKVLSGSVANIVPMDFPIVLGGDFAGVVTAVGASVAGFEVGDEVYGSAGMPGGSGALAQYAVAKAESIAKKPASISHEEAAAAVLVGVSALQAIDTEMAVKTGQKVLIHGGAGGIGSAAIQLAKKRGAYVAATAKTEDREYVLSLGADVFIDYKTEKFEDVVSDYDSVFDTVGGDTYTRSYAVLKSGGVLVSMTMPANEKLMVAHGVKAISQLTHVTTESLTTLGALLADKTITVKVAKTFGLDEAAEAFRFRESGQANGKVVITV